MSQFIDVLLHIFGSIDYTAIFFLMVVESSIIPFPSEVVMIPAGWVAAQWNLDPFLATFVWGVGSLVGALLNYFIVGKFIGKPLLLKYGKYFFITHEKYQRAETLFHKNDKLYTFIGRLIPVVRQLISVPAGIFKMNILTFCTTTFLWATLWCALLVAFGYYFWEWILLLVQKYTHLVGIVAIVLIVVWLYWKVWREKKRKNIYNEE